MEDDLTMYLCLILRLSFSELVFGVPFSSSIQKWPSTGWNMIFFENKFFFAKTCCFLTIFVKNKLNSQQICYNLFEKNPALLLHGIMAVWIAIFHFVITFQCFFWSDNWILQPTQFSFNYSWNIVVGKNNSRPKKYTSLVGL